MHLERCALCFSGCCRAVLLCQVKMDESASEWVFEYVHGVFQAPTWEGPIGTFIDDNCIVFDDEEENKLSHTEVHQV